MSCVHVGSHWLRGISSILILLSVAGCQPTTTPSNKPAVASVSVSSPVANENSTIYGISLIEVTASASANLKAVNGYLAWYLGDGDSGGWEQLDKAAAIRSILGLGGGGVSARIRADLTNVRDLAGGQIDVGYQITVRYSLTDSTGAPIVDETVTSNGTANISDAFSGSKRVRIGGKRAFEANVREFRNLLVQRLPGQLAEYRNRTSMTTGQGPETSSVTSSINRPMPDGDFGRSAASGGPRTLGAETGSGLYAYEDEMNFNVLDEVALDPKSGALTLAGRFDPDYLGPRIPYLQHLAVLLENPGPEFSLDWTPESERAMDRFLASMDDGRTMLGSLNLEKDWFRRDGSITEHGKEMVKMFGVEPVKGNRAAGWLGVSVRNPRTRDETAVVITEVRPGGPAARAGIRVGDQLMFIDGHQPRHILSFVRMIRRSGAGRTIKITADRPSSLAHFNVTLGQGPDPWNGFNREEMIAGVLRHDGNKKGANVVEAVEEMQRMVNGPKAQEALITLYFATASNAYGFEEAGKRFNRYNANVQSGRWNKRQAMEYTMRDIFRGMEKGLRFAPGSLVNRFDNALASGQHPTKAFDVAWLHVDELLKPVFRNALQRALRRQREVVMTVKDVAEKTGVTPVVKPTYIGIPADTQLSRALYQADYLGKSLVLSPELATYVPGFKTEYAYFADAGDPGASAGLDRRLWFAIDRLKLGQSKDGNVLEFRDVALRINIGPERGHPSPAERDYSNLLTSQFDALSKIMPALHELREAAKLAAAAKWLRSKNRRFRLPRDGRVAWQGPAEVPALVRLVWSPQRTKVAMTAPGGASLHFPDVPPIGPLEAKVPILDYPVTVDGSTVDLSDLGNARPVIPKVSIPSNADIIDMSQVTSPTQWIALPSLSSLPRRRITRTVPPVPQPLGFKALATRGLTLKRTLKLRLNEAAGACRPEDLQAINDEASELQRLMGELAFTEKIMNAITVKNLNRKATEAELAFYAEELQHNLETAAIDLMTRGLLDQYEIDKLRAAGRGLDEFRQGVDFALDMHKRLNAKKEEFERYRRRLELLGGTATADDIKSRNRLLGGWIDLMGDLMEDAEDIRGNARSAKAMRIGAKAIKKAKRYAKLAKSAANVLKIGDAIHRRATFDGDSAAAKELHGQYKDRSDALNAALKSPTMKALMAGIPCPAPS